MDSHLLAKAKLLDNLEITFAGYAGPQPFSTFYSGFCAEALISLQTIQNKKPYTKKEKKTIKNGIKIRFTNFTQSHYYNKNW